MRGQFKIYALAGLAAALPVSCRREQPRTQEVVAVQVRTAPADPSDRAWDDAPEHVARMIPQDLVEPRVLAPTTPEVKVRALSDGTSVAFRLEWADAEKSDAPGPARMVDACAVQIPEKREKELPEPQMGQPGKPVQVTYWRADWQASVDGRGDTIRDLYPNAAIDHYPFQAKPLEANPQAQKEMEKRYAPARALGNARSGPRAAPVEQLAAEGPGTLAPAPSQGENGKGVYGQGAWRVVIRRKAPQGWGPGERTAVAFAVWQGSRQEAGARKMRTGWIGLLWRARP